MQAQNNLQRVAKKVAKSITLAFDEYGVWDETVGKLTIVTAHLVFEV